MSKRLIRVSGGNIYPALKNLLEIEINAVTSAGNTVFGKIDSYTNEQVVLSDRRGHLHQFALKDLYEIVYDQIQAWAPRQQI